MIAAVLVLVLLVPVQSTPCGAFGQSGPYVGRVVHVGSSADLAVVGAGACTRSAWVGEREWRW